MSAASAVLFTDFGIEIKSPKKAAEHVLAFHKRKAYGLPEKDQGIADWLNSAASRVRRYIYVGDDETKLDQAIKIAEKAERMEAHV